MSVSLQVAAQWRDAPENPNRGQEPKKRGKKVPTEKPAATSTRSTRKNPASDAEQAGDAEAEGEADEE